MIDAMLGHTRRLRLEVDQMSPSIYPQPVHLQYVVSPVQNDVG